MTQNFDDNFEPEFPSAEEEAWLQAAEADEAENDDDFPENRETWAKELYSDEAEPESEAQADYDREREAVELANADVPPSPSEPSLFPELDAPREDFTALGKRVEAETVCLEFKATAFGFRRKVKAEQVLERKAGDLVQEIERAEGKEPANIDPASLHISKDLIDPKALQNINRQTSRLKDFLALRRIECRMLRGGMYLIPVGLIVDVEEEIKNYRLRLNDEVGRFLAQYSALKREAQERLGPLYNEADYPTPAQILSAYGCEYRWLSFNVSAALKSVSSALFERERRKSEAQWAEAAEDIRAALREGMAQLVNGMFENLGVKEDGKPRTFHNSMLEKMKTFLATFEARNLTEDAELQGLAEKARSLLSGIGTDDLRKNAALRENIRVQLGSIKEQMATLTVTVGRRINVDDME